MMTDRYILDDQHNPVPCPDLMKWAVWFGATDRRVDFTTFPGGHVSTVFLGLDHSFGGEPQLFETMAFPTVGDEDCERTATWAGAEVAHSRMVAKYDTLLPKGESDGSS